MPRAPNSSPEEHSSNIPASTDSHRRDIQAANIPAAVVGAVVLEAPAGRSSYPRSLRRIRYLNSSGPADRGTGRLVCAREGQVGRSCWILRLICLRRLTLGSRVLGVVFIASCNSERQCHECGYQND
jgi:hypothetical protein